MDSVGVYLRTIKKNTLTPEQTKKLICKAQKGSLNARNKIVKDNLRLVVWLVKRDYMFGHEDVIDLIAVGNLGLIEAVEKFDTKLTTTFGTYAIFHIKKKHQPLYHEQ